jgi:hypothetical protein
MQRSLVWLTIALVVMGCATASSRSPDLVGRAAQAIGGADTLAGVKTVSMKGTVRWPPIA